MKTSGQAPGIKYKKQLRLRMAENHLIIFEYLRNLSKEVVSSNVGPEVITLTCSVYKSTWNLFGDTPLSSTISLKLLFGLVVDPLSI